MTNFVAQVTLFFKDQFTAGAAKAKSGFSSMAAAAANLGKDNGLLDTSAKLAMVAGQTEPFRAKLAAALQGPSKNAAELESSLAAVNSVLDETNSINGDVAKTYDFIKKSAIAWGAGTAQGSKIATMSASLFTSTFYQMLGAGLSAQASVAATGRAAVLAKATFGSATEAGNLLAVMYNNMGNKSSDAQSEITRLSDVIAVTQGLFQIRDLAQFNEGLKYGVPVAKQYGISLEQLSTVIGQLNTTGLQGGMAGTAFSSMMSRLVQADMGTGQTQGLKFGIAYDPSGGVDIIKTLQNVTDKFGPLDKLNNQQKLAFKNAFGDEGLRAVMLLGTSMDQLTSAYGKVVNSSGAADSMAARMSDTYEDRMNRLENAQQAFQTKLGSSANKIKGFFADIKLGALNMGNSLMQTGAGDVFAGVAAGAGILGEKVLSVGGGALNVASQLAMLSSAAKDSGSYLTLFKESAKLFTLPFQGIGSGVGKAGSAIGKFAGSSGGSIGHFAASAGSSILDFASKAGGSIGSFVSKAGGKIASFGSKMASGIGQAVTSFTGFIGPALPVIAIIAAVALAAFLIIKYWKPIKAFFIGLWDGIKSAFKSATSFIWNLFDNKAIQVAAAIFMPIIGIPMLIAKNWKPIKAFFSGIWKAIPAGAKAVWEGITSFAEKAASGIKRPFVAIGSFFSGLWTGFTSGVSGAFEGAVAFVGSIPGRLTAGWTATTTFFKGLWGRFTSGAQGAFEGAASLVRGVSSRFTEGWTATKTFFSGLWTGFTSGVSGAFEGAVAFVGSIPGRLTAGWTAVSGFFSDTWEGIKSAFSRGFSFIWGLFDNKAVQVAAAVFMPIIGIPMLIAKNWEPIKTFFSTLWADISEKTKAAWEGIAGFVTKAFDIVKKPFEVVGDFFSKLFGGSKASGTAVMTTFASGVSAGAPAVSGATSEAFSKPAQLFPHSDAKQGPFSTLSTSGQALMTTFAAGITVAAPTVAKATDHAFAATDIESKPIADASLGTPVAGGATITVAMPSPAPSHSGPVQAKRGADAGGSYQIHIDNLTVQADEMRTIVDFVEILMTASGVTA